ncbi:zinc finger protein 503 [Hoplias malabaricus]|uniref:zinc finger protein 503 n=1 Tax=Hoplias malabaricus TaxID=27720 RepID=UPI003462FA1E
MITSPSATALRNGNCALAWDSSGSRNTSSKPFLHSVPPTDPLRQAQRLPIKVLKMLTARTGHILHPEYLQPLPSTPVSPIELDAKKSPLALLAQTCSQIGKPDPPPSSKLSSASSGDKESKSGPLKLSDIGAEDKSSFKPYSKPTDKKESSTASSDKDKSSFRVPSATCQPFTPRTGSPTSSTSASPLPSDGKSERDEKKEADCGKSCSAEGVGGATGVGHSGRINGINVDVNQQQESKSSATSAASSEPSSVSSVSSSALGSGLVAPVSPYKPGQAVFPLPPAGMSYAGGLSGAYGGYPQPFLPHGGGLVNAQLATSLGCSKAGSSPLAGASPPSIMSASLCRDPYCLSYHCASHLAGAAAAASCAHDSALKSGYPLVYPAHALHTVHSTPPPPPSFGGHAALYPYGFVLPNEPLPHACNWVSANGPCDKRFSSSDELLSHLRTHTAFTAGADKLVSGYPSSSSLAAAAAAAAMACHMHMPASAAPALRSPHHALGLSGRYHPYSKSPLPTAAAPVPVPAAAAATGPYYSPYALYGQRLTTASALGYQ